MARKRFDRLTKERLAKEKAERIYAELGDYDGVVETDNAYEVYARNRIGEVIKAHNYNVPNIAGLKVVIGRGVGGVGWQVIGARNAFQNPSIPNVASHDDQHRYLPVYRDQILPLMFLPTDDPFIIQIFGGVVIVDNVWAFVDNQTLDLSSYVPAAGALYVTLQYDTTGVVTVVTGSTKASKEVLLISDAPAASSKKIAFGSVRLYDTQTELDRANDFLYPFNVSGVSSANALPNTPLRVVVTDSTGVITTDGQLYYDAANDMLVLGNIAETPITGQRSFQIEGDGISPSLFMTSYGTAIAPFIAGAIADGSFASKTNVKSGMILLRLRGRGWDGSAWSNTQSEVRIVADADWSGTSHPTRIESYTTPIDSTTLTLAHTIGSDGLGRGSAMAFQRKLKENLSLADGASLVLAEYMEFGEYEIILNGDAEVVLL